MSDDIKTVIYNYSNNTKNVAIIIGISLFLILVFGFYPFLNRFVKGFGNFTIIILLGIAFALNFKNTHVATNSLDNLFTDPSLHSIRNNMLVSYAFTFMIFILILFMIHSFLF